MAEKQIKIKITSAVAIGGDIVRPGQGKKSEVSVGERLAKNLLHRGRAVLATAEPKSDAGADGALANLKVDDLKSMAAELEIEGAENMKKADLVEAIEAAQAE